MLRRFAGAGLAAVLLAVPLTSAQSRPPDVPFPDIKGLDTEVNGRRLARHVLALFLDGPAARVSPIHSGPGSASGAAASEAFVVQLLQAERPAPLIDGPVRLETGTTADGRRALRVTPAGEHRLEFALAGHTVIIPDLANRGRYAASGLSRHTGPSASLLEKRGEELFASSRGCTDRATLPSDSMRSLAGTSAAWCSDGYTACCEMIDGQPLCRCIRGARQ